MLGHIDSTSGLLLASFASAGVLVATEPDASHIALWGVLVTSAASVVSAAIKRRSDSKREEKRHDWEREDRNSQRAELKAVLDASDARAAKALEAAAELAARALSVSHVRGAKKSPKPKSIRQRGA